MLGRKLTLEGSPEGPAECENRGRMCRGDQEPHHDTHCSGPWPVWRVMSAQEQAQGLMITARHPHSQGQIIQERDNATNTSAKEGDCSARGSAPLNNQSDTFYTKSSTRRFQTCSGLSVNVWKTLERHCQAAGWTGALGEEGFTGTHSLHTVEMSICITDVVRVKCKAGAALQDSACLARAKSRATSARQNQNQTKQNQQNAQGFKQGSPSYCRIASEARHQTKAPVLI